ncbi:MAG: FkbM family methyltransferase, partial [Cyanobacteria bacterium K_DeepCast_35m_m2_023]|nr:FkbM family methyltransferase [Cyanobacteria bacterium K_DeepCast_35m_m2_023]
NAILDKLGMRLIKSRTWNDLIGDERMFMPLWKTLSESDRIELSGVVPYLNGQYGIDLLVALIGSKIALKPFFIEFGGTDGLQWSNTYALEKGLGWRGIISEPARCYKEAIAINRNCIVEDKCISGDGQGIRLFREVLSKGVGSPELSTLAEYTQNDWADRKRLDYIEYEVESWSFQQLVDSHRAPHDPGYLSIDVEGHELEIISSMDFSKTRPTIISVEHNFNETKLKGLREIMQISGYVELDLGWMIADAIFVDSNKICENLSIPGCNLRSL